MTIKTQEVKPLPLSKMLEEVCEKIAPVWSLDNFVAVNPYLGLTDQKFESVAQKLSKLGGVQMTLPISFYQEKLKEGFISKKDIHSAFLKKSANQSDFDTFLQEIENSHSENKIEKGLPLLVDVARNVSDKDWPRFYKDRITSWASSYFDTGQATWNSSNADTGIFQAWKKEAECDFSPEIAGLKEFRKKVKALPNDYLWAIEYASEKLGVSEDVMPQYLHRLLLNMGGWSAFAARLDWEEKIHSKKGKALEELIAVLISWEACLLQCLDGPELRVMWSLAQDQYLDFIQERESNKDLLKKLILQEAFEQATQRELINKINNTGEKESYSNKRPDAQAVFCIDVRSEIFRRNLEHINPSIETIGFAGFFGFPINFVPLAHEKREAQCPALIPAGPTVFEELPDKSQNKTAVENRIHSNELNQLWKSFKSGAVSCFSFVSPLGLSYLPKLLTDSLGWTRPVPHPDSIGLSKKEQLGKRINLNENSPNLSEIIPLDQKIQMAKNALRAMTLDESFSRLILIVGHGSSTVNNPHASGLDCGACGGHSGEANAKVAALVLNDFEVRMGLKKEQIFIPEDTVFLACLHDTTTDKLRIFNEDEIPTSHIPEYKRLKESLNQAEKTARAERAIRMNINGNVDESILKRSKDWSQVRPEWGLAGCTSFIIAPRFHTKNINLGGKSFLHSYNPEKDKEFKILEQIMTAPMVVTSWINLQYFASTVDNSVYGSGNKTLHNVTAGIGVLEGYSGDLRVGLPLQSVHDGQKNQHDPSKLHVVIQAPIEAINSILKKHESIRNLSDNGWVHLLTMNSQGKVSYRYLGDFEWELV
jgi:uncharacterized protein YbcC (UPF0753/DUF2309 family)